MLLLGLYCVLDMLKGIYWWGFFICRNDFSWVGGWYVEDDVEVYEMIWVEISLKNVGIMKMNKICIEIIDVENL